MFNFIPAKILSYDAATRTAKVQIEGLTDGAEDGLTATFAYPTGYDDRDTEIQVLVGLTFLSVPVLTLRQFKRFFVLSGLDIFIDQSLPTLRAANPEMYADVVSQLDDGTVYFYDVAESFMTQMLHILPNAPTVDFDQSTHHHIVV